MSSHHDSISLNAILHGFIQVKEDILLKGITLDSREVKPGYAFIALPGERTDGRQFIEQAKQQGAKAIIAEAQGISINELDVPLLLIQNLQQKLGIIAARFYQHPSKQIEMIAVTGTNGKTSCSHLIAKALCKLDNPCGIIGTIGYGFPEELYAHNYTTPDAINLQRLLSKFFTQGAKTIAMEVSSHALVQGRVQAIDFNIGIFTNLTRDHLDYHGDMASYAAAKRQLFLMPGLTHAIINIDDPYGRQWAKEFASKLTIYTYSVEHQADGMNNCLSVQSASYSEKGITAEINTPWGKGTLHSRLLGKFNLSNLLAVLTVLGIKGIPLADALHAIHELSGVPGRMETYGGNGKPLVVIDYAHTPDALQQALSSLRYHSQGVLWCVFGCGGDRDRGKRSMMGYVAQQLADQIILTNDNPRHESPSHITADIMQGIPQRANVIIEHDRRRAIAHAIACAKPGDIVLIAGKGHESYQQMGDERYPFDDAIEVKLLLN